jgi:hypothetical protein
MVYKTLHRRLKIEQHKQKTVMNSSTPEGSVNPYGTSLKQMTMDIPSFPH